MEKKFKMGRLPSPEDAIKFQFASYFSKPDLPTPPKVYGVWQHFWNIHLYDNDKVGDCVMAGAANETASWYHDTKRWVKFTTENVLSDYSAVSGYDPRTGNDDSGVDMATAAEYRRKTGIVDHNGIRHRIDAYVKLPKQDWDTLKIAMYLFGAVGIGFEMPDYTQHDFNHKIPWDVKSGNPRIEGGHYTAGCGIDGDGHLVVMTWGGYQRVTKEFYEKYCDEACGYFSIERLINRSSPEGFKAEKLIEDLKSLKGWWGYDSFGIPLDKDQEV